MTDPVEELVRALTLAEDVLSRFPFSAEIWPNGTHPNAGIEQIRSALSRFNAEMGKGVWVPREPTEAMLEAAFDPALKPSAEWAYPAWRQSWLDAFRAAWPRMIAAINPEGNDE